MNESCDVMLAYNGTLQCDTLVVGGGIAGLMASIAAAEKGASVIIAEKANTMRSGSGATGNDHFLCYIPEKHGSDIAPILKEMEESQIGACCDRKMLRIFAQRSEEVVRELRALFNSDVSIFFGNKVIVSSLSYYGGSAVGTTMDPEIEKILTTDVSDLICTYDVQKSLITTGILPKTLMNHPDSVTSRFPLNPMTAVGPLAVDMMRHNLDGECPSPHGVNSSWKFCLDHNAIVVGLGIDLTHHLTISHVVAEAFPDWPVSSEKWFRRRSFDIKDEDFQIRKTVLERQPRWGMLHYAEKKMKRDMIKNNLLKHSIIENIRVDIVDASDHISFLRNNRKKGFPYYGI